MTRSKYGRVPLTGSTDEAGPIKRVLKHSPLGALYTRKLLDSYNGSHTVGVCDIEARVTKRTIGTFTYKGLPRDPDHKEGLVLETVLFSAFYPAKPVAGKSSKAVWVPNLTETVHAFLNMAPNKLNIAVRAVAYPVAAILCRGTTFPAIKNAELQDPINGKPWPVMLFSPGVGCTRLMYSGFCGEMATRGYVVIVIEHRDGTGPISTIQLPDGTVRHVDFVNYKKLNWPNLSEQPKDDTALRKVQLEFRRSEIGEILNVLRQIAAGNSASVVFLGTAPQWGWERWRNAIQMDNVVMAGHSLGASAAALVADEHFKFDKVVLMDTAAQRLEPWSQHIACPVLSINSHAWSEDLVEVGRFVRMCQTANQSTTLYLADTTHASFCDIHLLLPNFMNRIWGELCDPVKSLESTVDMTVNFINDTMSTTHTGYPIINVEDFIKIRSQKKSRLKVISQKLSDCFRAKKSSTKPTVTEWDQQQDEVLLGYLKGETDVANSTH